MTLEKAYQLRTILKQVLNEATTASALEAKELFPLWVVGIQVQEGERYQYNNDLYQVVTPHTTQIDWTPDKVPALFKLVSIDEFPEWKQPLGASDAYQKDDKVTYDNQHWVSIVNNNVWQPGIYGWNKIDE